MLHPNHRASVMLAFVIIILMAAATANASLLDCTTSVGAESLSGSGCTPAEGVLNAASDYAVKDALPVPPINSAPAAFQVDQTRTPSPLSNSVLMLVLMGTFLAVVLVRAKRFNTK